MNPNPNGGGGRQPIGEGMIQFAGWIVFAVLAFFFLALALDFIQDRMHPDPNNSGSQAARSFGHIDKASLVRSLIKKQPSSSEDRS